MSDSNNVVSFNTGIDIRNHREVLEFLANIDLDSSMAYLPVTIHDECVSQEEYIEYLHAYIQEELDYMISEIAESDPKLWKRAAESLRDQRTYSTLIRFVITLTSLEEGSDVHELVLMKDPLTETYVLIQYFFNHESLVSVATNEFLDPEFEGFEPA